MVEGQTITGYHEMTKAEQEAEGWDHPALVLELSNGIHLYASRDPEGNGPGTLLTKDTG